MGPVGVGAVVRGTGARLRECRGLLAPAFATRRTSGALRWGVQRARSELPRRSAPTPTSSDLHPELPAPMGSATCRHSERPTARPGGSRTQTSSGIPRPGGGTGRVPALDRRPGLPRAGPSAAKRPASAAALELWGSAPGNRCPAAGRRPPRASRDRVAAPGGCQPSTGGQDCREQDPRPRSGQRALQRSSFGGLPRATAVPQQDAELLGHPETRWRHREGACPRQAARTAESRTLGREAASERCSARALGVKAKKPRLFR